MKGKDSISHRNIFLSQFALFLFALLLNFSFAQENGHNKSDHHDASGLAFRAAHYHSLLPGEWGVKFENEDKEDETKENEDKHLKDLYRRSFSMPINRSDFTVGEKKNFAIANVPYYLKAVPRYILFHCWKDFLI